MALLLIKPSSVSMFHTTGFTCLKFLIASRSKDFVQINVSVLMAECYNCIPLCKKQIEKKSLQ